MSSLRVLPRPETLFLLFALPFGLVFVFCTPPLGGGDENMHFLRIATLACNVLIAKIVWLPAGIPAFVDKAYAILTLEVLHHHSYTAQDYREMAAIALESNRPIVAPINFFAVYSPIPYLPQIVAFKFMALAEASPLVIFYAVRLVGMLAGVGLTWCALCVMPSHRYLLCALALLPTLTFFRSLASAENIANAWAFLYVAVLLRAIARDSLMKRRELAIIALLTLTFLCCKNAYLLMPLLACCIPAQRFESMRVRLVALFIMIVPGILASLGWMWCVKTILITGARYTNWSGDVYPDGQMALILHHPFDYALVLLRTLAAPEFIVQLMGLVGILGWMNIALPLVGFVACLIGFALTMMHDTTARDVTYAKHVKWVALLLAFGNLLIILTLLYSQWTRLGAPVIEGFQGRYLYPMLPMLFLFIKPVQEARSPKWAAWGVAGLASVGLSSAVWAVVAHYFY